MFIIQVYYIIIIKKKKKNDSFQFLEMALGVNKTNYL